MEKRIKLKDRRLKFIDEYLVDFDAPAAAIRAGYSEHSAYDMSSRLMRNEDVKAVLDKRLSAYKKKYEIRREKIIEKLYKLIDDCEVDEDRHHLVKSLDMLNKMSGNYTHTVVNLTPEQPLFPE